MGAGVVGLAVARQLAGREGASTLLLERHGAVGTETSSRNSEVRFHLSLLGFPRCSALTNRSRTGHPCRRILPSRLPQDEAMRQGQEPPLQAMRETEHSPSKHEEMDPCTGRGAMERGSKGPRTRAGHRRPNTLRQRRRSSTARTRRAGTSGYIGKPDNGDCRCTFLDAVSTRRS